MHAPTGEQILLEHGAVRAEIEEAGGKAARPDDGSPYRVDQWDRKGLVAAATPSLWEAMAARINSLAFHFNFAHFPAGFRFFFQNRNVYSRMLVKKLSRGGQAHNASADD